MTQEHRPDHPHTPTPAPRPPPADPAPKPGKPGWIDDLAQRSAGLPGEPPPPEKDREKSPWSHAGAGIQFALTTALFAFMGVYVDRHWGTPPWGIVGFTLLGLVGGMYLLIKDALKDNAAPGKKGGKTSRKDDRP